MQVISNDFVLLLLLVFLVNSALMAFGCAVSTCIQRLGLAGTHCNCSKQVHQSAAALCAQRMTCRCCWSHLAALTCTVGAGAEERERGEE